MRLFDLQVNGALGIDFSDPCVTEDQVGKAFHAIIDGGTEHFLPTIITAAAKTYERNVSLLAAVAREPEFTKHIPGIHLEGPFLSTVDGAIGAHNPQWVTAPDLNWLDRMQEASGDFIAMITLAPEKKSAVAFIKELRTRRIVPALGHSMANYAQVQAAEQAGALLWTHFGNGVPSQIERHNNPLWAALGSGLQLSLIADGHHIPLELIRTLQKLKGDEKLILVSDASPLCGCQPGDYQLWGKPAQLAADGSLRNPETGYCCGSAFTLKQCVNYLEKSASFTPDALRTLAWDNPKQLFAIVNR